MIQNKHEVILDAIRRRNNGESVRSIAASHGLSHTTLNTWLAEGGGPRSADLREQIAKRINRLFIEGLSASAISAQTKVPIRTVEKYKSAETKAILKARLQARRNFVREQLALGVSRKVVAESTGMQYSLVSKIARGEVH